MSKKRIFCIDEYSDSKKKYDLKKLLFHFDALADLSQEITSVKDFKGVMKSSLYLLMGTIPITKGTILTFEQKSRSLKPAASKGISNLPIHPFPIDPKTATSLKIEDRVVKFHPNKRLFKHEKDLWKRLHCHLLVPMVVKNELIGIIVLGEKLSKEAFSEEDIVLLSVITKHIGICIYNFYLMNSLSKRAEENQRLFIELQSIYYDTIQALAAAIDAKDPYTRGHSYRVSNYCEAIAKELDFSKSELEGIKIAGFLHDIGKIAIDRNVINKPSSLSREEFKEIYKHPVLSYEILSRIKFPWKHIPSSVLYHHEKIDGTGYPEHLTGIEIPKMAKVMALADAFDAMTTDRPYKKKRTLDDAIYEIRKEIGRQFDPDIVKGLFSFIKKDINSSERTLGLLDWVNFNINPSTTNSILNKIMKELSHLNDRPSSNPDKLENSNV